MRETLNSLHAKLFLLELDPKTTHVKEKYRLEPQILKKAQDRQHFSSLSRMKGLHKKFTKMLELRKDKNKINLVHDAVI